MSLPPVDWHGDVELDEDKAFMPAVPWEDGQRRSLPALGLTVDQILRHPKRFFRSLPLGGGLAEPFGFALLLGTMWFLSRLCWQAVFEGTVSGPLGGLTAFMWDDVGWPPQLVWGLVLLTPGYVALSLFLESAFLYLALRLVGPLGVSFEAVFRVVAYSQAAAVFSLLPWLGGVLAPLYQLALLIIGLAETLLISLGRAVVALILAGVLLTLGLGLLLLPLAALGLWRLLGW